MEFLSCQRSVENFKSRVKGIDGGYKLSELLSRRRGSADAFVNVATVKFRFGAHVLSKKLVFNETYERLA